MPTRVIFFATASAILYVVTSAASPHRRRQGPQPATSEQPVRPGHLLVPSQAGSGPVGICPACQGAARGQGAQAETAAGGAGLRIPRAGLSDSHRRGRLGQRQCVRRPAARSPQSQHPPDPSGQGQRTPILSVRCRDERVRSQEPAQGRRHAIDGRVVWLRSAPGSVRQGSRTTRP